jgi:isoquinoline 1-oxidoreductase beta subunit
MRPATHHRVRASVARGRVVAFEHATASVGEAWGEAGGAAAQGGAAARAGATSRGGVTALGGRAAVGGVTAAVARPRRAPGAADPLPSDSGLYNFGRISGDSGGIELAVPLGAWRSVDSGTTRTAEEIVVDEIARKLGEDPVAFRRATLRGKAVRAVLDKAATAGRWGRNLPAGHGQGIAVHEEYGSCVACLAEIDATDPKKPRVTRVVMAADVGTAVNPSGLKAQLMGTAIDGISTVLQAGLHIDRGAVREGSFADFHYARQRHAPLRFEAHILPSRGEPGGAGELGVPAAAGAVANAYARATGTRPRSFPINF